MSTRRPGLPEAEKVIEHARGRVELTSRGDVLATVASGHIVVGDARALTQFVEVVRRKHTSVRIFHDWEAVTGYDSEARVHLTRWTLSAPRKALAECHVLVRSRLVAMGVSTAALALHVVDVPLSSYSVRAEFEAKRAAALARALSANEA